MRMRAAYGNPSEIAVAKGIEAFVVDRHWRPAGINESQPTCEGQHAQRHDEGRESSIGDTDAVNETRQRRRAHSQGDGHDHPTTVHRTRKQNDRYAEDRPYGEVDATRENHERHADREDADDRHLPQHVQEVGNREKAVRQE